MLKVTKFNPHNTRIDEVFWWPGIGVFRRGHGIFYRAHLCMAGIIYEHYRKRRATRAKKFQSRHESSL